MGSGIESFTGVNVGHVGNNVSVVREKEAPGGLVEQGGDDKEQQIGKRPGCERKRGTRTAATLQLLEPVGGGESFLQFYFENEKDLRILGSRWEIQWRLWMLRKTELIYHTRLCRYQEERGEIYGYSASRLFILICVFGFQTTEKNVPLK